MLVQDKMIITLLGDFTDKGSIYDLTNLQNSFCPAPDIQFFIDMLDVGFYRI